jgi:hypothetical protein
MRAKLLVGLMVLAVGIGAGCASTNGSPDGGGTGGTGGSGGLGGTGGGGGASATDCAPGCGVGKICVGTGVEGGALFMPNDAGMCPAGRHLSGNFCEQDLSYACQPMPSACSGTLACTCADTLCPSSGGYTCQVASASELLCVILAP